ncbi:MAG: hypothetical protein Q8O13_05225 [Candidatus Omnitrophota bacterium]|nr:hypothetical protein [Candidatus Omnitrophota bacterium]
MFNKFLVGFGIIFFALASFCFADQRAYVWTYEYMTMPKGKSEVEYYLTTELPDNNASNKNTLKHWLEYEYGLTDHWDVAIYQQFLNKNKQKDRHFKYDGFKIRTRYRLAEKKTLPLDTLFYLEYKRNSDFSKPNEIEAKLVLAKDIGDFNLSYNQVLERALENEGKTDFGYAIGVNRIFSSSFKAGIESKGSYSDKEFLLGPTIAYRANKFWWSMGVAFGTNHNSDDFQSRLIIGAPF